MDTEIAIALFLVMNLFLLCVPCKMVFELEEKVKRLEEQCSAIDEDLDDLLHANPYLR